MTSDAELVGRVRQGDLEAFGQLCERYERTLLAVALGELRDLHAAEDAVQGALLLAFRRLPTLLDQTKFGPWVMQIVRRQTVEAMRVRRVPASVPLDDRHDEKFDEIDETRALVENEHLLSLVARLPEHEGLLVGLRYFDGHSMAEIAEISARPLGTVTKQLSRAVARLRTWYDKENLR